MAWQTRSTDSPREIAERFAKEQGTTVVPDSLVIDVQTNTATKGWFKLASDQRTYSIEGVPPGYWTIARKFKS